MSSAGTHDYQPARINEVSISSAGDVNVAQLEHDGAGYIKIHAGTTTDNITIQGIKRGYHGQKLVIQSDGTAPVWYSHLNASAAAEDKLVLTVTSYAIPVLPERGFIFFVYDGISKYWRMVDHNQGVWYTIPYDAGRFHSSSGTWTVDAGDIVHDKMWLKGNTLFYSFDIVDSALTVAIAIQLEIDILHTWLINTVGFLMWQNPIASGWWLTGLSAGLTGVAMNALYRTTTTGALTPWTVNDITCRGTIIGEVL